jgi:hypothetical protein
VGGASRSQRLAQPCAERGAADPRWPSVACFSGKLLSLFPLILSFRCLLLAARHLLVSVFWRQELEHRARDKYGALDQMNAELRQLREQRDALEALAEALRTQDGWLSYRAEALRVPPPSSGFAQPSSIGMRRCNRRGVIWRRCAPWRLIGRRRCRPSGPRTGRSARGSGRRSPSKAGPRSERGKLSKWPRRPTS